MTGLKKGFFYLLAGSAGQSMLRVVFTAVLARILTPQDFGLLATATIVTGFAELFVHLGFGKGLVQKKEIDQKDVGTAYTSSLVLGLLFAMVLFFLSPFIATFFEQAELENILRYMVILFPVKSINQVQFSLLQRDMNFKALAGREALSFALGYGLLGITLAYLNFGVYALVWGILAQAIIYSVLLGLGKKKYFILFTFHKDSFKHLFSFGKKLTIAKILNYFALKGDYFIVSKQLGVTALGFYSRAYGLMNFPNSIVGNILNTVLFAEFSKSQDDKDKLTITLSKLMKLLFFTYLPVSVLALLLAPEIIFILLGDQWSGVIIPFRVLSVAIAFRVGYKITSTLIKGVALTNRYVTREVLYCMLILLGSYFGSLYGIAGVSLGVGFAILMMFLLLMQMAIEVTFYTWSIYFKMLFNSILFTITVTTPVVAILYFPINLNISPAAKVIVCSIITSLVFLKVVSNRYLARTLQFEEVREIILSYKRYFFK